MTPVADVMQEAKETLYAPQVTKDERTTMNRKLVARSQDLAAVAREKPAVWAQWLSDMGAAGGFSEQVRELRRLVTAINDAHAAEQRAARRGGSTSARDSILARLSKNEQGRPKPSYANIVTILRGDPKYQTLRMSELGGVVEVGGDEIEEGPSTADLCEWLRDSYGIDAPEVAAKSAMFAVAQGRKYSPVRDYLENVRGKHGDGSIVSRLMVDGLGIKMATPMHMTFLGRFLIGSVARAMQPGCKHDTALVLVGEQGAKKSTFFKDLFGVQWFADSPISIGNKDAPISMSRVWGYEAAEMESIVGGNRSAEAAKQFMGTSHDLFRPPFARTSVLVPRHTVLCGTVNPKGGRGGSASFLADPSGSRRFWVLSVPPKWVVPAGFVDRLRDEAWAWALQQYEAGERWWLERDEDEAREADAEQYQVEDVWQDSVSAWLEKGSSMLGNFTTREALIGLGVEEKDHTPKDAGRMRAILVRLGWSEKCSPAGFRGKRVWQRA